MKRLTINNYSFWVYKWKCINIIPQFSRCAIVDDGSRYNTTTSHWISVCIFGTIFNMEYPSSKSIPMTIFPKTIGWFYSRKHKCWKKDNGSNVR